MRLRVSIPQLDPSVMEVPDVCPYEDCDGQYFKTYEQHCKKPLVDIEYEEVDAIRRKCLRCQRTHRAYPQGVSKSNHSDRLKALGVFLYMLGISYRDVEEILTSLGCPLDHTTVCRDVQAAGEEVDELRRGWLEEAGQVNAVAGYVTQIHCEGETVVIGVTVNAQTGLTLEIRVADDEKMDMLYRALQPLLDWWLRRC